MIKIIKIHLSLLDSQSLLPLSLSLSHTITLSLDHSVLNVSAPLNVIGPSRPRPTPPPASTSPAQADLSLRRHTIHVSDPPAHASNPPLLPISLSLSLSLSHRPKPPITNITGPDEICGFSMVVGDVMVATWGLWVFVGDWCCSWFGVCW